MTWRTEKLLAIKASNPVDAFLITSSTSLKYLCGYFYNFETGPSPFQFLPAALYVSKSQNASLVMADNETGQVASMDPEIAIRPYSSYTYEKPMRFAEEFKAVLLEVMVQSGKGPIKLGIEMDSLPLSLGRFISSGFPGIEFTDISSELRQLRMIKDEDEISSIRKATRLCDTGQEAVIKYARPGISELELFTLVRGDIEQFAGQRIPMMADLVCGSRTAEGGGNPSGKIIQTGDLIMSDLTPCLAGYWGDTCNTFALGRPGLKQRELFLRIKETLQHAISAIRPGILASEIDRVMRKQLQPLGGYSHHSGHGVGLAYHEEPRIVPYNNTILKPNMVIALEPGIYANGYGIRLEHLVLVTPSGCEVISGFDPIFEK